VTRWSCVQRSTTRINTVSFWNSLAQWTRCLPHRRETGRRERNSRRTPDTECTFTSSTIPAPFTVVLGIVHKPTSQLEHGAPSNRPNSKTSPASSELRTPKPETKSERSQSQKHQTCRTSSSNFFTSPFCVAPSELLALFQRNWPTRKRQHSNSSKKLPAHSVGW